jgi:hypothetical protein
LFFKFSLEFVVYLDKLAAVIRMKECLQGKEWKQLNANSLSATDFVVGNAGILTARFHF